MPPSKLQSLQISLIGQGSKATAGKSGRKAVVHVVRPAFPVSEGPFLCACSLVLFIVSAREVLRVAI
jgi:hypothetical protein